ncbi:MAG: hypothetical protein G3M70_05895 [Candidatus Nitronauta litoralis]|uniref:Uncharacterized protein n=1 Tax=Candidatus Nitronauta litoralis TaxID=2705533 RepID=A0A7T0FZD8_9BACT|nr:MAG: hypothetical protein G3M70_05895 [Candidatus Nitronauta litoralis]
MYRKTLKQLLGILVIGLFITGCSTASHHMKVSKNQGKVEAPITYLAHDAEEDSIDYWD